MALYADDAEVQLVDRLNPPGSPRVLRGKEDIRSWVEDVSGREMTHRIDLEVMISTQDGPATPCGGTLSLPSKG